MRIAAATTTRLDRGLMLNVPEPVEMEYSVSVPELLVALRKYGGVSPLTSMLNAPLGREMTVERVIPVESLSVTVPSMAAPVAATPATVAVG